MRVLCLIIICVLLGATTTVGVAWGMHLLINYRPSMFTVEDQPTLEITVSGLRLDAKEFSAASRINAQRTRFVSLFATNLRFHHADAHNRPPVAELKALAHPELLGLYGSIESHDLPPGWSWFASTARRFRTSEGYVFLSGWPCRATIGGRMQLDRSDGGTVREVSRGLLTVGIHDLACHPLPLGFTVDTMFYGAIWFGLIMCPGIVRRRIRKRRGLCPSCGYDMRGCEGVCAECGQ